MAEAEFAEDGAAPEEDRSEERSGAFPMLMLDLGGYEGPIDLLLELARQQKVDLAQLSILRLADQYLAFIARMRQAHLELAADYLVMAAWLAYLKSRLLLPEPQSDDEPSGAELAEALAFQLRRLEAMRAAGEDLLALPQLGQSLHARGAPEEIGVLRRPAWQVSLYELLKTYAETRQRGAAGTLRIEAPDLYSVDEAIRRLEALLGRVPRWSRLQHFLPEGLDGLLHRSALSAHFVATLELCRQGKLDLRQDQAFGPLWLRSRTETADPGLMDGERPA